MTDSPLGPLVRHHRTAADLTIEQLAAASGVSDRAISDIERGASRGPQHRTMLALADALRLSDADRSALLGAARQGRRREDGRRREEAPQHALPLPRIVSDFTGREGELVRIAEALHGEAGGPSPLVLVTGPPGFGKSTLAVQAAETLRARFAEVLFVDLRGLDATPLPAAVVAGRVLGALRPASPPVQADEVVERLREVLSGSNVLLVLDNASSEDQVRAVLPPRGPSAVLVTSRRTLGGLTDVRRLTLAPLEAGAGARLLAQIVPPAQATGDDLDRLARLCDDVPLALRIAGNRLASRSGWTVAGLASRLTESGRRLDSLVAGDLQVKASFRMSYELLGPDARQLFRRLSLAEGPTVGAGLAAVLGEHSRWRTEELLDELADLSFVQHAAGDRYQLHDLLRLYAGHELDSEESASAEASRRRADAWLLGTVVAAGDWFEPGSTPAASDDLVDLSSAAAARSWLVAEAENWLGAIERAAARGEHRPVVDTCEALHWFSDLWTRWGHWDRLFELSSAAAEELGEDRLVATHLGYLAWAQFECLADFDAAARSAQSAYDAALRTGDDHLQGWAVLYVAIVARRRNDDAAAHRGADLAVEHFRRARDREGLPQALVLAAERFDGYPEARLAALLEVVQLVVDPATRPRGAHIAEFTEANAQVEIAEVHARAQRWQQVLGAAGRAVELSRSLGNPRLLAHAYYFRGLACAGLGDEAMARDDLTASLELRLDLADTHPADNVRAALAQLDRGGPVLATT